MLLHTLSLSSPSSSSSSSSSASIAAVAFTPYLKRLRFITTSILGFRHTHTPFLLLIRRLSSLRTSRTPASLFRRPSSSSKFFPANSWFSSSPMEGILLLPHHVSWACYSMLIILSGACCALSNHHMQLCKFPIPWLTETQPEAIAEPDKRFWSGSDISRNKAMVEQLQQYGVMSSNGVAEVMEEIDRGLFVPEGTPAYMDSPMPIGYNATISAPHMHATCLQLLEKNLQPGMSALDIGSGTGYLTACFAMMVGPQGRAVGVEHIPELVADSIENIKKSAAAPLLKEGSLSMHVGDGRLGWAEHAPYDAIHVGAAALEIPKPLIDQLKPGGRMVIPVGNIFQDLKVVEKDADGSIKVRDETSVRYVPLTSREAQLRDSWF